MTGCSSSVSPRRSTSVRRPAARGAARSRVGSLSVGPCRPKGERELRRTKIIATLGPSTDAPEVLSSLLQAGADVVRLNAAHSNIDELDVRLATVRQVAASLGMHVGVLVDLAGPKIRVGDVAAGTVLRAGERFEILSEECVGDSAHVCISYDRLADDVSAGDLILLDDGRIELTVVHVGVGRIATQVGIGGELLGHKGVNVPGVRLSVESISEWDRKVIEWAQAADVDWLGQSFVRSAEDVAELRRLFVARDIPILAKIEKREAIEHIEEILNAADAVMVARGDLGVETSPEVVPVLQRRIVEIARGLGRPAVIATEMLDSMRTASRPTRAEASDVASAVFGDADALMLSGETAVGAHPIEAVATMARIVRAAEGAARPIQPRHAHDCRDTQMAVSAAVAELAADLDLAAIITLTQSGATALAVARNRPDTTVIAATPSLETARRLALVWGVTTVVTQLPQDLAEMLDVVIAAVRDAGMVAVGTKVAVTAGLSVRASGGTDSILVREVFE